VTRGLATEGEIEKMPDAQAFKFISRPASHASSDERVGRRVGSTSCAPTSMRSAHIDVKSVPGAARALRSRFAQLAIVWH